MVTKMLTELGRRMEEHNENFNKKNIRKCQVEIIEPKNTTAELKNTLGWENCRK